MKTTHEEPPKPKAQVKLTPDDYEYILVQVTNLDVDAGDDKSMKLRRDGWERVDPKSDPEKDTGVPGYFYMKKPKAEVEKDRAARLQQFLDLSRAPLAQGRTPAGVGPHGKPIVETIETDSLSDSEQRGLDEINRQKQLANG